MKKDCQPIILDLLLKIDSSEQRRTSEILDQVQNESLRAPSYRGFDNRFQNQLLQFSSFAMRVVVPLSYVVKKNISENRTWNLFVRLELRLKCLGQGERTSSKGISEESTVKHESGGD